MDEDNYKCNHGTRTTIKFQNSEGQQYAVRRRNCFDHRLAGKCVLYIAMEERTFEPLFLIEWNSTIDAQKFDGIKEEINRLFKKVQAIEHANLSKYICHTSSRKMKNKLTISVLHEFMQGSTLSAIFLKHSLPCGILFLQHIAAGCLKAIEHLHAMNLTCNGLDASQVYLDYKGDIKIALFNIIGIVDGIVSEESNDFSKTNDILCFGNLMTALINGSADAKKLPKAVTGNLRTFMRMCLRGGKIANATDLLQHPFLNKNHPDYDWSQQNSGPQLSPLNDFSSMIQKGEIGRGGFGRVFLIKNQTDRKEYALKLISLQEDDEYNPNVTREVVLLAELNHINVVRYFSSGIIKTGDGKSITLVPNTASVSKQGQGIELSILFENDDKMTTNDDMASVDEDMYNGSESSTSIQENAISACSSLTSPGRKLFILMEYCEKTLAKAIKEGLYLESDRVWRLFREMLNGLMYIHSQKLIHRDLKPDNIFLDANDHVKIGDFGLATKRTKKDPNVNTNGAGNELVPVGYQSMTTEVGTHFYVAPELSKAAPEKAKMDYDNKMDMYSLGIIFFEMCYKFETGMERHFILSKLREEHVEIPNDFAGTSESHAESQREIIKSLLNHDPNERPTCDELLQRKPLTDETELQREKLIKNILSKPNTPAYIYLLATCFKQTYSDKVKAKWHDLPHKNEYNDDDNMLIMDFLSDKLRNIFKLHGYHNFPSPLFLLDCKYWNNCANVKLMTQNGLIVSVPFDLRLPFAQYIGKTSVTSLRRFTIERVFREEELRMPREYYECAFDIVSSTPETIYDAEILTILCQIIKDIPIMNCGQVTLRVNHTELVKAILEHSGIKVTFLNYKSIYPQMRKNPHVYKAIQKDYSMDSVPDFLQLPSNPKINNIFEDLKEMLKSLEHFNFNHNKLDIVFSPGLLKNISQYSGMMYQLQITRTDASVKPIILAEGGRYDKLITDHCKFNTPDRHVVGMTLFLEAIGNIILNWTTISKKVKETSRFVILTNIDVIICGLEIKKQHFQMLSQLIDHKLICRLGSLHVRDLESTCRDLKTEYAISLCSPSLNTATKPISVSTEDGDYLLSAFVHAAHKKDISGALSKMVHHGKYNRKIEILCIIINAVFLSVKRQYNSSSIKKDMHLLFPLKKNDWTVILPFLYKSNPNIYYNSNSNAFHQHIIIHSSIDSTRSTLHDLLIQPLSSQ